MFDATHATDADFLLHENRFPLHNMPDKGQILGGSCNTTGCECTGSTHWHALHFAFYCNDCAEQINAGPAPACEIVEVKPDLDDMQVRWRYAYKAYRH